MSELSRREFNRRALKSLLTVSLIDILYSYDALGEDAKPIAGRWVAEVNQLCRDVKDETIKQLEWQKKVEELLSRASLAELLRLVDFDKLTEKIEYRDKGELSLRFDFDSVEGIPAKLVFGKQIFALKKGASVVPHGHNNMATAFLILKGELQGRHYDRISDEKEHLIIKPTIDRSFEAGGYSTVSDYKDNVHWFTAKSERAFIFNFHVLGLNPGGGKTTGRVYVDPKGEKIQDGLIRARLVSYDEVLQRYG